MICKKLVRLICIALIAAIFISTVSLGAYGAVGDIAGYWAEDVITIWIEKGFAKGYTDGTFRPNNHISRAEFMSLVNNAFDYTEEKEINYSDVSENKWYTSTIKRAVAQGYISGYQNGTMRPDNPITREEVAAIITKIKNLSPEEKGIENFKDKNQIKWSKGYVGAVVAAKYMVGFPDGTFRPQNNITRGEAIFALNNIISNLEVRAVAKQDFFGVTYIRVNCNNGMPSSIKANGIDLTYDKEDGQWKGTALDLNIGDKVEVIAIENGVETKVAIFVKDILDN